MRHHAATAGIRRRQASILAVVAAGGALGSLARHALEVYVDDPASGFPLATFLINGLGCVLIGMLMVAVEQVLTGRVLVRPFLGVGVLGGFTTFSTYAVDVVDLLPSHPAVALSYLAATPLTALLGVLAGVLAASLPLRAVRSRPRGGSR